VLRIATLGYVAATTDLLWGRLLVENGVHWSEHRPFRDLEHYLDAIVELDPRFRPFYEFVDSLLCYRPPKSGQESDAREVRAYLERGIRELPNDGSVWLTYGQFLAFMGPSYLSRDEDRLEWRREGARAMLRAVDLGADSHFGIAASSMMDSRFGERDTAINALERAYAITDDEAKRAEISAKLEAMHASRAADRGRTMIGRVEAAWRREYPFVSKGTFLLLGPVPSATRCVGVASTDDPACAHDWDTAFPNEVP
jgi:tetratricopeptide (TPR) repeat protein